MDPVIHHDVGIPGPQGVELSGDLYLPPGAGRVPALVTIVPYRKDMVNGYESSLRWFAEQGFAGVLVDHAGIGCSDGIPHEPWGEGETDDAVAVIEWAAAQPWCDGSVGIWGMSHGGFTSLAAAARRPPALRGVIAIANALDVERDAMHPGGRGDILRLAQWGTRMLAQQLLPPLRDTASARAHERWEQRLRDTDPVILGLARMGPGHPAWRRRTIDVESILAPTFCVGGWRDLYADAVPRAYERLRAPKKLLMGPWAHTLPHSSPFDPIDFLPLALRWWNHWLRGSDTGIMDEPPVTIHIQGADPGWRAYDTWPPAGEGMRLAPHQLAAVNGHRYRPDPTSGVLSGLRGIGLGSFGAPRDQHDDDMRALAFDSKPLPTPTTMVGRPEVTLRIDGPAEGRRLVVRLAEVDAAGRSTFLTGRVIPTDGDQHRIALDALAHRVAAGSRLRVVVSDADFPRLVPLSRPQAFRLRELALRAPTIDADAGQAIAMPELPSATSDGEARWTITRDPLREAIDVTMGWTSRATVVEQQIVRRTEVEAQVSADKPDAAMTIGADTIHLDRPDGRHVDVKATSRCTQTTLDVAGEVKVDEEVVFSRTWSITIDREL